MPSKLRRCAVPGHGLRVGEQRYLVDDERPKTEAAECRDRSRALKGIAARLLQLLKRSPSMRSETIFSVCAWPSSPDATDRFPIARNRS